MIAGFTMMVSLPSGALLCLLLLMSCAAQPPAPVPATLPEPPAELITCRQDGFRPPDPLPRLRTVEQVAAWAQQAELARQRTQAELMDCARKLDQLHQWIDDHR